MFCFCHIYNNVNTDCNSAVLNQVQVIFFLEDRLKNEFVNTSVYIDEIN